MEAAGRTPFDFDVANDADKLFAAKLIGREKSSVSVLYPATGAYERGRFRGEVIGSAEDRTFQRVGDSTVVAHKESSLLNGRLLGKAVEVNHPQDRKNTRTVQVLNSWDGKRSCQLTAPVEISQPKPQQKHAPATYHSISM